MNNRLEKYRQFFTKEYLMGPNSFRLLDELVNEAPVNVNYGRVLDLGCGEGLTSMFLANETKAKYVYALDLWISATDIFKRIAKDNLEDKIIPIHGDALNMPFSENYFDAIVSVDSYHYFGCENHIFDEKILPFLKKDGYMMIVVPGIKENLEGHMLDLFNEWTGGEETKLFQTALWWENHLKKNCSEDVEITVREGKCFDIAWKEWFESGHKYGERDREFLSRGLDQILNFVFIYIKKKEGR